MTRRTTRMSAGAAIFARLRALGATHVFGNSGTDFPPVIEGLARAAELGLPLPAPVIAPHEHAAMGMAHGAWLATGRLQAVMLHTNVGLANGIIGALNAWADQVPVIVMSGRTPGAEGGRFGARTVPIGWGQEMRDQHALIRECAKWDHELRFPEQIGPLLDRAAAIALSPPMGPVYLSLPREVLAEAFEFDADAPPSMAPAGLAAPAAEIERAAALFAAAERPAIFAQRGGGTAAGLAALARIAENWAAPVADWWAVEPGVPRDHPSWIGWAVGPALAAADAALVVDSLAPWSPDLHPAPQGLRVVQLGPDPLMARTPVRTHPSEASLATETGPGLVALEAALRPHLPGAAARIAARRPGLAAAHEAALAAARAMGEIAPGAPMTKGFVGARLAAALARRPGGDAALVLSELGAPYAPMGLAAPARWRQEPHAGGLGWSLPAALGAKLAEPARIVAATMGDGSFVFANPVACLQIAAAERLAPLVLVLNNAEWGAVRQSVLGMYPDGAAARANRMPFVSLAGAPDFAKLAEAGGAFGLRVAEATALDAALDSALDAAGAGRMALLDIAVAG